MNKAFDKILERLDELIEKSYYAATEGNRNAGIVNHWIPCSERLPEENKTLKVWLSFTNNVCSYVKRAIWFNNRFEYENGKVVSDIPVAWMQYRVPEAYKTPKED